MKSNPNILISSSTRIGRDPSPPQKKRTRDNRQRALAEDMKCEQNFISGSDIFAGKFLGLSLHEARNVVVWSRPVTHFFLAHGTVVDDHPPPLWMLIDVDGLHQPSAERCAVSGALRVDMFGKKAGRAVIAVGTIAKNINGHTTVFTDERFLACDESHECEEVKEFKERKEFKDA